MFRMTTPRVCVIVFVSGKIVLTGYVFIIIIIIVYMILMELVPGLMFGRTSYV